MTASLRNPPAASPPRAPRRAASPRSYEPNILTVEATVLAGITAATITVLGIALLLYRWSSLPAPGYSLAAWLLFAVTVTLGVAATLRARERRMPTSVWSLYLCGLLGVAALDAAGYWQAESVAYGASATLAVGFGLLLAVPQRGGREILIAIAVFASGLGVAITLSQPFTPEHWGPTLRLYALACLPTVAGVAVITPFRRVVARGIDRALAASTVAQVGSGMGISGSERLVALDHAAEDLLMSVADGHRPLPLDRSSAEQAASLATELRMHLLEARRRSWLVHAVTESDLLGPRVTVNDDQGSLGHLDRRQREGLLSALWLLVDTEARGAEVAVDAGAIIPPRGDAPGRLPLRLRVSGVPRRRIDDAVWSNLRLLGRLQVHREPRGVRVEAECAIGDAVAR